jgi:hypothetical protein
MSRTSAELASRELLDASMRSPWPRAVHHHQQHLHVPPTSIYCGTTDCASSVTPAQIRVAWSSSVITPVSSGRTASSRACPGRAASTTSMTTR